MKWEKEVNRQKALHRNIYSLTFIREYWFDICITLLGLSAITNPIESNLDNVAAAIVMAVIVLALTAVHAVQNKDKKVEPYGAQRQFIGLYTIKQGQKLEIHADNGLIPRDMELEYLKDLLYQCFAEGGSRRGICLTGRSGSGKSTVLNLLEYDKELPYKVENFSDSYTYFEDYVLDLYRSDPEKNVTDKTVFIMDHFERYFSMSEERKRKTGSMIKRLSKCPIVFIFSMREEFFVPFLAEFNINDMDGTNPDETGNRGILFYKNQLTGNKWKPENNVLICGGKGTDSVSGVSETMGRLCVQAFGVERGEEIYRHFEDSSLIQQQIIFNMLKHDFDKNGEIRQLDSDMDENAMMRNYYDVQLCSTGDYFMASRIMYLLCTGRSNGIAFTDDDIRNALLIWEPGDVSDFRECLSRLYELSLIKYSSRNSTINYEIAHDYIAKSYDMYAGTELPANVKGALDEFKSEYLRKTDMNRRIADYRKKEKWKGTGRWGISVFAISMIVWLLALGRFFFMGRGESFPVLILCFASLLYVFTFYMKLTRHYRRKSWFLVHLLYGAAMLCGTLAVVFPDFWLLWLGAGNAVNGLSCVVIGMNSQLAALGKKWFLSYGLKTVVVGILLIILAGLVSIMDKTFLWIIDVRSLMQFLPMAALLIYSYMSHMNKEFFYAGMEGLFSTGKKAD